MELILDNRFVDPQGNARVSTVPRCPLGACAGLLSQELCPHLGDPGDCLLNRLLREEGCSIEEARQWRQAYLRFLWLKAREGDVAGLRLCASPALERAWRLHVLDTKAYARCCEALLLPRPSMQAPALLHFNPDGESGGSIAGAIRTLLAYERHVGRLPGPAEEGGHYWLFPCLTGRAIVTVDYPWGEGGAAAPPRSRRQVEVVAALQQPALALLPLLPGLLLRAGLQLQARTAVGLLSSLERPLWSLLLVPEEEEGGQASSSASHSRLRLVLLPEEEALLPHEEEKEEEDPSATVQALDPSWGGERQWQQWQHEQQPAEDDDDGGQLCVQAADEQGDDEAPAGQPVLLRSPSQYHPH